MPITTSYTQPPAAQQVVSQNHVIYGSQLQQNVQIDNQMQYYNHNFPVLTKYGND
jgi:hypothetical protein